MNKLLREGDPSAFGGIFKLTHQRLLSYCRLFVQDQAQAADLVQECYISLWEKKSKIVPTQSVESLLFVMLRNRCLNYLRDNKFLFSDVNFNDLKEIELQHLYELDFTGTEKKSLEEELIEAIKSEIEKLPERRKMVFVLSKINGLKNSEIADQLNISIKAVEKHLKQAKDIIRKELLIKYPMFVAFITYFLK